MAACVKISDVLVDYSCSCNKGGLSQGWLYLSEHYLAFYSFILGIERKILVELKNIVEIRKEKSKKGLLADTIYVATSDKREFYFSNLFSRDATFDTLQSLVNRAMQRLLFQTSNSNGPPGLSPSSPSTPSKPSSVSSSLVAKTLKEEIDKAQLNEYFSKLFRLPPNEEVLDRTFSLFWMDQKPDLVWRGDLFLSTGFLAFFHGGKKKGDSDLILWSLPAACVKKLEKVWEEGPSNDPYIIALTTCHGTKFFLSVGASLQQCNQFCSALREVLVKNVDMAKELTAFLPKFPSESLIMGDDQSSLVAEAGFGAFHGYPYFDEQYNEIV